MLHICCAFFLVNIQNSPFPVTKMDVYLPKRGCITLGNTIRVVSRLLALGSVDLANHLLANKRFENFAPFTFVKLADVELPSLP